MVEACTSKSPGVRDVVDKHGAAKTARPGPSRRTGAIGTGLLQGGGGIAVLLAAGAAMVQGQTVSIAEALDVEHLNRVFIVNEAPDGTPSWFGQVAMSSDGTDAAEVQVNGSNLSHDMSTEVEGPVKVKFLMSYKTEADPGNSRVEFLVDDAPQFQLHGNTFFAFQDMLAGIGPGTHRITWRYVRNTSYLSRQYVRVDQLEFLPPGEGPPAFLSQPPGRLDLPEGGVLDLSAEAMDADFLQWTRDGVPISGATGPSLTIPDTMGTDTGIYRLEARNAAGTTTSLPSDVRVWTVADIPGVLDNTAVGPFVLSGDGNWMPTRERSYRGDSSMRTPVLANGESADLCVDIAGPAQVRFRWRTDCERRDDVLKLLVDGIPAVEKSGRALSRFFDSGSVILAPGGHTLCFRYQKDGANSHFSDTAWLDYLTVSPSTAGEIPPSIQTQPMSTDGEPGDTITLSVRPAFDIAHPYTLQWLQDGEPIEGADDTSLVLSDLDPLVHGGQYVARVTNANGTVDSDPATVEVKPGLLSGLVETWRPPTSQDLRSMVVLSDGTILCFGDGVMLRSTDGGMSFDTSNPFFGRQVRGAAVSDDGEVAVVGPSGFLARSSDGGTTWTWDSAPTNQVLNDVAWARSDTGEGGVFVGVGNAGIVVERPSGDSADWQKVEFPDREPRNLLRIDAVGSRAGIVASAPEADWFWERDCETGEWIRQSVSLDGVSGHATDVCGQDLGGDLLWWIVSDGAELLQLDGHGQLSPTIPLPAPARAIACSEAGVSVACSGQLVGIFGGGQPETTPLPEDLLVNSLVLASDNSVTGVGEAGAIFRIDEPVTEVPIRVITLPDNPPAVDAAGEITVVAGGTVDVNGRSWGPFTPAPASIELLDETTEVNSAYSAILFTEDLGEAPYAVDRNNGSVEQTGGLVTGLLAGESAVARSLAIVSSSGFSVIDVVVTSEGRVLCGDIAMEDVTQSIPYDPASDGAFSWADRLFGRVYVGTERGAIFSLFIHPDTKEKSWTRRTDPCPDLEFGDIIVEMVQGSSGNVIAKTRYGTVLRAEEGGAWIPMEGVGGSGSNVSIGYYEPEGFLVYSGSRKMFVIEEDFSATRAVFTGISGIESLWMSANGDRITAVTQTGGVLAPAPDGPAPMLEFLRSGNSLILDWPGPPYMLQRQSGLGNGWSDDPDAVPPLVVPMDQAAEFFRVVNRP